MMRKTIIICILQIILNFVEINALILDSSSSSSSVITNAQQQQSPPLALTANGASNIASNGSVGLILEQSIAAIFSKVAYGSTTTKRSIPDNVYVPSLTTVPTPIVTTNR